MTKRIFRTICLVAISVFLVSALLFLTMLYSYFSDLQHAQLRMQTGLAAKGVQDEGMKYLEGLPVQNQRITWIGADGGVRYDSLNDADGMENHLQREEVQEALVKGYGESARYSSTLTRHSLYSAQRLPDGTVLRLSVTQDSLLALTLGMLPPVLALFGMAVILSVVMASRLSRKIVSPFNALNLEDPLENEGYEELSPLLHRMDAQQKKIARQREELRQKQSEFEAVTTGMREGLILLNNKGSILSLNRAAARLLAADGACVGQDLLSVNRSLEWAELLDETADGQCAQRVAELGGGRYQLNASPVVSDGKRSGTVLLLLDVTEKEKAEQLRREFTANVSHELKTPLQTISGCSELLANGMVKPADVSKFGAQIHAEAQRMIRLVEDILKLSRLDEGAEDAQRERMDLYVLAKNTLQNLRSQAETASVTLTLSGSGAVLYGIPAFLSGILLNLCDNAIKYNRPGGSVNVEIKDEGNQVVLTVADTGIGIPQEHQERIFERFYRVDKSRSKAIGGTGLGLSIVKHAARLHHAEVKLHSVVGEGTIVTVVFPKTLSDGKTPP